MSHRSIPDPERSNVNAVLYINKSGAQWRMLPKDFPPRQTEYDHFSNWKRRRAWRAALDELNRAFSADCRKPMRS